MEAVLFSGKRTPPTATITSADREVEWNRSATRWLGVWLDSHLTLKAHQETMRKKGRNALMRLRRLTGQMGFTSGNCRKVMSACVQAVAMYGTEPWWKGTGNHGTRGGADDLQKLVHQEARAVTGCFRTANLGALMSEAELRPAPVQVENRQRRYGLRLLGLPQGSLAKEVLKFPAGIGRRLVVALEHSGRTKATVLQSPPGALDGAALVVEDRIRAKETAEHPPTGLVIFTDGSKGESGAAGYAVTW